MMNKVMKKKELCNYFIDFGVCIFCGNCVEYCFINCFLMMEEYELVVFDCYSFNYDNVVFGCFFISVIIDFLVVFLWEFVYLLVGEMDFYGVVIDCFWVG